MDWCTITYYFGAATLFFFSLLFPQESHPFGRVEQFAYKRGKAPSHLPICGWLDGLVVGIYHPFWHTQPKETLPKYI